MGIIEDIASNIIKIFDIARFKNIIDRFVRQRYSEGSREIADKFNIQVQFGDQERDISMIRDYTFDNIKGMTDEMQAKLRQTLQRGMMGNETKQALKKRISDIFKGDNPTRFRYEDRIEMITRTEGKRAANMARFSSAQKSGLKLFKYLRVRTDDRTSDICMKELGKYGEKDLAIPLDQPFEVVVRGKAYKEQYPPFHPNCRTSLVVTQNQPKE